MIYSPNQIYDAATAIRPYISELLDAPKAQRLNQELNSLLITASPDVQAATQLNHILLAHEATREWIRFYLDEQYQADTILEALRVYYPLPALNNPVKSPRYICPVEFCQQDWYRHDRDAAIPLCPVHDLQLVIDA